MIRQCLSSVMVLLVLAGTVAAEKLPVPSDDELKVAHRLVDEAYGKERGQAKTVAQRRTLAVRLLANVGSASDPAGRYALLEVVRDIAIQAGDGATAFDAIDKVDLTFQVDALQVKMEVLQRLSKHRDVQGGRDWLVGQSFKLMKDALAKDDFDMANSFLKVASAEAHKSRDRKLLRRVVACQQEISEFAEAYEEMQKFAARLEQAPSDPEANLAVGWHLGLANGNWDEGIPFLVLGGDSALSSLAVRELQGTSDYTQQADLGDGWWDLAEGTEEGIAKDRLQARSTHWYERALPGLTGMARDRVETRLASVAGVASDELDSGEGAFDLEANPLIAEDGHRGSTGPTNGDQDNIYYLKGEGPVQLCRTYLRCHVGTGPDLRPEGSVWLSVDGKTWAMEIARWKPLIVRMADKSGGWNISLRTINPAVQVDKIWVRFSNRGGNQLNIRGVEWCRFMPAQPTKRTR